MVLFGESMKNLLGATLCAALTFAGHLTTLPQSERNGDSSQANQTEEKIYTPKEVSKKAVIISKPIPQYTLQASDDRVEGTVVLKAVFRSSGKVTNVKVLKGLPDGLTEAAIEAARKIKFKPAEKDGHPVSMFIALEYNFRRG